MMPTEPKLIWPLIAGVLLTGTGLSIQLGRSRGAEEIGLGAAETEEATFADRRISAHVVAEYGAAYPPSHAERHVLWLGNSQLFSMTRTGGESRPANEIASESLNIPVVTLALPNGNPSEHLIVLAWALARGKPDHLVLPVMFSDLREVGTRDALAALLDQPTKELLAPRAPGSSLVADFSARATAKVDDEPKTPADASERWLNRTLASTWPVWARRGDLLATTYDDLTRIRNLAFGIKKSSKRKILPAVLQGHMAAVAAMLDLAAASGVPVLVYATPLRQDVEPPYVMSDYRDWKVSLEQLARSKGAAFADYDALVPAEAFATKDGEPDFKHFNATGHALLGAAVAGRLASPVEVKP